MKPAQGWSSRKGPAANQGWSLALGLLLMGSGCAVDRAAVEHTLMLASQGREGVAEHYRVGCPDVVAIQVAARPEFNARYVIGPDGRIDLGEYGALRIEGKTPAEIAQLVAAEVGAPAEQVSVRVADYRSQRLLLFGEVTGWQRSLAYQGQETVLDVLQRVGGITPGAEPADVYVVRPRLDDGRSPQVFHVDLRAIVVKGDLNSNIRVQPLDQIYVGETSQARVEKTLPPWLKPLYQKLWSTHPTGLMPSGGR